ncbi:MAG: hypothetical protein Q7R43_01975 [Candidatus Daviesbacteria bacterium]|nr:hypothetical protein [Candidatus Daviesbacteria bacterium]
MSETGPENFSLNPLDHVRDLINSVVNEAKLPTQEALGYESTVGIYGGKLVTDPEGKMVYDTRGVASKIDQKGDAVLRTYDEHTVKNPSELLKKHPKWFLKFIFPGSKRYRGIKEEIAENAKRLGLEEYYGLHPWGIEIKKPEIFKSGRTLQDIYRADLINSTELSDIDRFTALAEAAKYIRNIHDQYGAIGEIVASDIIFRGEEGNKLARPILNIPDLVYNPKKITSETEKKATDVLDFLMEIGFEEFRRSKDWEETKKALKTIVENYGDEKVIQATKSLAKRGRLTLTSQHNQARLGVDKELTGELRKIVIEICEKSGK